MGNRSARWSSKLAELVASGPIGADDSLRTRLELMRWVTPVPYALILTFAGLMGGLCEAGALLVIVRVASALTSELDEVPFSIGVKEFEGLPVNDLLAVAVLLTLGRLFFHLLFSYGAARASASVILRLRDDLMRSFLRASWSEQSTERQGVLQDYATSHSLEVSRVATYTATAITAAVSFATMLVTAFVISQTAAALMGVAAVVLYLCFRPLTRMARTQATAFAEANSEYASVVSEAASMAMETTTFGVGDSVSRRIRARSHEAGNRLFNVIALSRSLSGIYQNVALLALIGGLAFMASRESGDLTELGVVVIILLRALSYSQTFQSAQHYVNELLPFASRTRKVLNEYEAARRTSGDDTLTSVTSIEFDHLSYGYDAELAVVRDLTFAIGPGEAIGVVGPSGAGKSTLAQLLLRLRVPDSGAYLVSGQGAEEYSLESWHERVAFVPQVPRVLRGSVSENVAFFRDIDDATIEAACKAAHLHDEILRWPDGYRTELGQGANDLSGGERQRLCIARALAGNPDLLVLDEPTSALDMHSEAAIQATLVDLKGQMMLVIIAHRVPTLRLCDRVIVMRDGLIEACEPPGQLADTNPFFADALRLSSA